MQLFFFGKKAVSGFVLCCVVLLCLSFIPSVLNIHVFVQVLFQYALGDAQVNILVSGLQILQDTREYSL